MELKHLDRTGVLSIISKTISLKNDDEDEYAQNRPYREQGLVKTCRHGCAEWTLELQEERTEIQVLRAGVATVIKAKGIGDF